MILSVKTRERTELIDITSDINQLIQKSGTGQGLCMVYVPHTTAAVTINEGTWQGIFFCELDGPRTRKVDVRIIEERFVK